MEPPPPTIRVKNQFLFDPPDSTTACVAISLMATYHQYDLRHLPHGPAEWQWRHIMRCGVEMWRRWRASPESRGRSFPTMGEILALPSAHGFVAEFGAAPVEYAGMVRDTRGCDNIEGSLEKMLLDMIIRLRETHLAAVCCLLTLPGAICVSMLCLKRKTTGGNYEIRFFDSHGSPQSHDYVEFRIFDDYRHVLEHIKSNYRLPRMDERELDELNAIYSLEELQSAYGYSAMLFIK